MKSFVYPAMASNSFPFAVSPKNNSLTALLRLIQSMTGFDGRPYRESTLRRRLEIRLHATNCRTIEDYISFIRKNPQEAKIFQENLLIHVSRFFRDRSVFTYLERRILPSLLDNLSSRERRTLRVWSVGCASGEEPFSLAMIIRNPALSRGLHPIILATDVSPRILARAREALYRRDELRFIPNHFREVYCSPVRLGLFRISPALRRLVVFRQHDLIRDESPGTFDLILCRNLLIFFRPEAHEFLCRKMVQSLTAGGILVLGRSETLPPDDGLRLLSGRFQVYQKSREEAEKKTLPDAVQGDKR